MRKVPYVFSINFDSDVAASGGTSTKDVQVDGQAGSGFVIEDQDAEFWITAALGAAVSGTPLAREPSPGTTTNNQMPNLSMLTVEFSTSADQQWQDKPIRLSNVVRKGVQNWNQTQRLIPEGTRIVAKITNNAAVAVQGQITFIGYRMLND